MKILHAIFMYLLLLIAIVFPAHAQTDAGRLEGNWLGTLDVSGIKVRFVLKVGRTSDGYTAKLDVIDQDVKDLAIDTITLTGNTMKFSAAQFGMSYEGTINEKKDEISGTYKQGDGSAAFVFKRIAEMPATIGRRQDPKRPYTYVEEEVVYKNAIDNIKLTGTLTLPKGDGKYPAVILISGSGPQNRDSLVAGHRPFLVLADHLTRRGIAVLRVDDRGTGGSDMGSLAATSENFLGDVLAGVDFLKSRQDIDAKRIGLIGHSEGGMIAPMAAARSRDIAYIVMLAGPGQRGEDVIYTQNELSLKASGTPAETIANVITLLRSIMAVLKAENDEKRIEEGVNAALAKHIAAMSEEQRKAFAPIALSFKESMSMFKLPWYRFFVRFDPAPVLKKVGVPVLALNGELDTHIASKENLDLIAAGLEAGGNADVTVKAFPKLNHLFQTSTTGLPSEYQKIDETISPQVLETITDWILKHTKSTTSSHN